MTADTAETAQSLKLRFKQSEDPGAYRGRGSSGRRASLAIFALFFGIAFTALVSAAIAEESNPAVSCSLDLVSERLVPGGFVTLTGWAADMAHGAPVARMEVWLDDSVRGDVLLSGPRPDIASHFGRPDYLLSGWTATVSLGDVNPGPHRVEVVAYSVDRKRVPCGTRSLDIRAFPRPVELGSWRIGLTLLGRVIAFLAWLTFVGWGPMRMIGGRAVRLAPSIGLSLFAVATEAGAVANVRPLSTALIITALSVIVLVFSTRRHAIRLRNPGPVATTVFAIAAIFALVASIPLVRHGEGSVLGPIADAAWESSVADSIARFGWKIPTDVHGHLAAVPSVWRAANFRAGAPYPLALIGQVFGIRTHEAHGVLMLAIGTLVICATGTLASYLFRGLRWIRAVAVGLAATNSILLAQLYNQHAGVLIATFLYLSFVYCLIGLLPLRPIASIVPVGLLLAGAWTLYPETMVLWFVTATLVLVLSGSWGAVRRKVIRLTLAVVLAALANPIGLVRTARFTNSLRHASALATAELRKSFGDTHHFPSPAVIAGVRPYHIDSADPSSALLRMLALLTIFLLVAVCIVGLLRANRRDLRMLILLLAPVTFWLFSNRLWEFPYGYSKGLPHLAPLWSLSLAILVARTGSPRSSRWGRPLAKSTISLVAVVSIAGSIEVVGRAIRAVPAYDSAFRSLPVLVQGMNRSAVIIVAEPLAARREWIGYFLGEYRIVKSREEASSPPETPGQQVFELFDRRGEEPVPRSNLVRSGPFFALVGT